MADQDLDYSKVFYGSSALFAVLSVLYLGFEYLQDLSPFTISAFVFAVFAATFFLSSTQKSRTKLLYSLISAGSYIVFLIYVNAKFLETTDQVLASLIISAGLFSVLGYIYTERKDLLPDESQIKYVLAGLTVLMTLLLLYDVFFVEALFLADLNDEVSFEPGGKTVGEADIVKKGFLPVETDRRTVNFCLSEDERPLPAAYQSFGGETTGFLPSTETENITMNVREQSFNETGIERGQILEIVQVTSCRDSNLSEGQLGVELGGNWLTESMD